MQQTVATVTARPAGLLGKLRSLIKSLLTRTLAFVGRHKKFFIITSALGVGAYVVGRVLYSKYQKTLHKLQTEQLNAARMRLHFDHNKRTEEKALKAMLPQLQTILGQLMNAESLAARLRDRNLSAEEKVMLWDSLKVMSVTRIVTSVYVVVLAHILLSLQLHMIGRCLFQQFLSSQPSADDSSISSSSSSSLSSNMGIAPETQRKFLQYVEYFQSVGIPKLAQRVQKAIEPLISKVPLQSRVCAQEVLQIIGLSRSVIENGCLHPNAVADESSSSSPVPQPLGQLNLCDILLPPEDESLSNSNSNEPEPSLSSASPFSFVASSSSSSPLQDAHLTTLTNELRDLLESQQLFSCFREASNAAFVVLAAQIGNFFHETTVKNRQRQLELSTPSSPAPSSSQQPDITIVTPKSQSGQSLDQEISQEQPSQPQLEEQPTMSPMPLANVVPFLTKEYKAIYDGDRPDNAFLAALSTDKLNMFAAEVYSEVGRSAAAGSLPSL